MHTKRFFLGFLFFAVTSFCASAQPGPSAPGPGTAAIPGTIQFEHTRLPDALHVYAQVTGRTLLKHPQLPNVSFTFTAAATNNAEAAAALEKAFSAKGIATVMDGERFAMVVPEALALKVHPGSGDIKDADPASRTNDVHFPNIDVNTFLNIYSSLAGKTFKSTANVGNPLLSFESQGKLTREEIIYGFDTVLKWNGIKVVPLDEKTLTAVLISGP
jgi:hypothetical protein